MGAENYGDATESVKAIRNHLRALYDPVHGSDSISHADLYEALQRTQRGEAMPSTTDENLTHYFSSLAERDRDVFNQNPRRRARSRRADRDRWPSRAGLRTHARRGRR